MRRLTLIIYLFCCLFPSNAQQMDYLYSTDRINDIAFDGNNYWVASANGIKKYNPMTSEVQHYTMLNSDLPSNYITVITIGPDNTIWAGTYYGLVKIKDSEVVGYYDMSNSDIPFDEIADIKFDSSNRLWCSGVLFETGFFIFDGNEYEHFTGIIDGVNVGAIGDIEIDNDGVAWMDGSNALGESLISYDGIQFKRYIPELSHNIKDIFVDQDGLIWSVTNNYIHVFDGENWTAYTPSLGAGDDIRHITQDSNGDMLITTWLGGIMKFSNNQWIVSNSNPDNLFGFGSCLPTDNNEIYVCSYANGLLRIDNNSPEWEEIDLSNSVLTSDNLIEIKNDNDASVWIISGYQILRHFAGEWTIYDHNNIVGEINYPEKISIDNQGNKWIITRTSGSKYKALFFDNNDWLVYDLPSFVNTVSNRVIDFAYKPDGTPLLLMAPGFLDFNGEEWVSSDLYEECTISVESQLVNDSQGNLIIATSNDLWILTENSTNHIDLIGNSWSPYITALEVDNDDNIYFAFDNGTTNRYIDSIALFEQIDAQPMQPFTKFQPLMRFDHNNILWSTLNPVVGNVGVFKRVDDEWENMNEQNSSLFLSTIADFIQDLSGNFWFVHKGYSGITRFNENGDIIISDVNDETLNPIFGFNVETIFPNPTISNCFVEYTVNTSSKLSLDVYDMSGNHLSNQFENISKPPGSYIFELNDIASLSNGIFLVVLSDSEGNMLTKKVFRNSN